eukprot:TRINITY_DN12232_c0_g1_i1.p1 TRINITY_DN12232_c0_g1~~TRINITY_DN12232_c0_g1_i1.p1  ORF type:complete len:390 (-),score=74.34 TRINITY_DN12232_c0_g1_i1:53-1141(-)
MDDKKKLLWVDQYRPKTLSTLDFHKEQATHLSSLVTSGDFPHLLFYGPSGAGKKTRVMAVLRELFGTSAEKINLDNKTLKIPNKSTSIELTVISSAHHIELNPSDAGNNDRYVVQEIIKEIASNQPLDAAITNNRAFKIVVLNEVDRLSKPAQHGLRRTMEKYMSVCRLVMVCNSTSKVIDPLRSRCLSIRVAAPTNQEIVDILTKISKKEAFQLPPELALEIAKSSGRNLRRAILSLEATKVKQDGSLAPNLKPEMPDWEEFIVQIAREIMNEQTAKCLMNIRQKLYELISHCIPPEIIIRRLTLELLKKLDSELKYEVTQWAAHYEHRLQLGSKAIFHLEAFIAKFMSIYAKFLANIDGY